MEATTSPLELRIKIILPNSKKNFLVNEIINYNKVIR